MRRAAGLKAFLIVDESAQHPDPFRDIIAKFIIRLLLPDLAQRVFIVLQCQRIMAIIFIADPFPV